MRKIAIMAVILTAGLVASADLANYSFLGFTSAPENPAEPGTGGYQVSLIGINDVSATPLSAANSVVFNAGSLFLTGFSATGIEELTEVKLRVYDSVDGNTAGSWAYVDSVTSVVLPDLDPQPAPGSDEIQLSSFDFTGAQWVAVPEPATIGLMGIAGLGLFLARRKTRR